MAAKVQSADYCEDVIVPRKLTNVVQGIDKPGVRASQQDEHALGSLDKHSLVVIQRIGVGAVGI